MTIKANLFRLNLGCGPHYAPGWVNIDRYREDEVPDGRRPDLISDILHLPYDDASCSRIYMGHLIEHLTLTDEVPRALIEIRRVLGGEGSLMVVAPDIKRAREGWPEMVSAIMPGENDEQHLPGLPHKWAPTERKVLDACLPVFPLAMAVPIADVGQEWPVVNRVGWQSAIWCQREP